MHVADLTTELTPAEQAEHDADVSERAAAAEPAKVVEPAKVEAAAEPAKAVEDPHIAAMREQTDALVNATKVIAAAVAPKEEPAAVVVAEKEPDWEAERVKLRESLNKGEIDDDEYETRRESLLEQKVDWRLTAGLKAADTEVDRRVNTRLSEMTAAQQQQAWDRDYGAFTADAGNAEFVKDPIRATAFKATLDAIAKQTPAATYAEMLAQALVQTKAAFGIKIDGQSAAEQKAAIDKAARERDEKAGKTPTTLDRAPAAGAPGAATSESQLDNLPISELEDTLARMSPAQQAAYLEGAPGGPRDNPKAG